MFRRFVLSLVVGAIPLVPSVLPAAEPRTDAKSEAKPPVEIKLSPRVGRVQEVEGNVNAPGMPIVFIKSGLPTEPWWVQNLPTPTGPKQFKVRLLFGNEKSAPGSQFHVVTVLMPKGAKLQDYKVGTQHHSLPEFPQSNRLQVTLMGGNQSPGVEVIPAQSAFHDDPANKDLMPAEVESFEMAGDDDIVSISTPTADSDVRRMTEINGKVAEGHFPVVLIRPLTKENLWWIQNRPVVGMDGTFKGKLVFGSEKTPEGTRFRVLVLAFEDAAAADKLKAGASLKQLPEGVKTSSEITITVRNLKANGVEAKKPGAAPEAKTAEVVKEKS